MSRSSLEGVDEKSLLYPDQGLRDHHAQEIQDTRPPMPLKPPRRRHLLRLAYCIAFLVGFLLSVLLGFQGGLRAAHKFSPLYRFSRNDSSIVGGRPAERADKAVVLASYWKQNVAWAKELPSSWWVYRYINNDDRPFRQTPQAGFESASNEDRLTGSWTLTVPERRGNEAMTYLTFIIDNYDSLPLVTVFLHGHDRSWHQLPPTIDIINALNFTAILDQGYVNINCYDRNHCQSSKILDMTHGPAGIPFDGMKPVPEFWTLLFGVNGPRLPTRFAARSGGQFAASRDAIRSRPLKFWKALRRPLMVGFEEYKDALPTIWQGEVDESMGSRAMGTVFEQMWHVLFGKPAQYCEAVSEEQCTGTTFSGAISCDLPEMTGPGFYDDHHPVNCTVDEGAMARAAETQREAVRIDRGRERSNENIA